MAEKKDELGERRSAVSKGFKPGATRKKKVIQQELDGMPEKGELYRAGEELVEARINLSKAQELNEIAADKFIELAKKEGKTSITVKVEGEDPRTLKYEKSCIKEKVTMRKEK